MTDTTTYDAAIAKAREIGAEHGENTAGWWEQDAIGGHALRRQEATSRWVLQGIEDGDPEVLDSIPAPDLSGEWADGYSPQRLLDDCGIPADASLADFDAEGDMCDAYEEGFQEACVAAIVKACRSVLDVD